VGFLRDVEVAFEGEAGAGDGAFVEETADEGDAVGNSAAFPPTRKQLRHSRLSERRCAIHGVEALL